MFCAFVDGIAQDRLDLKFGILEQDGIITKGKFHIIANERFCRLNMYDKNVTAPIRIHHLLIGISEVSYNVDSTVVIRCAPGGP